MRNLLLLICLVTLPAWGQDYNVPFSPPAAGGDAIADNCTILLDFDPEVNTSDCGGGACDTDFETVTSITVDGSRTTTLQNQSTNPEWVEADSRFNGKHSITFGANAITDRLTNTADDAFTALPDPRTYYAVVYDSTGKNTFDRYVVDGHSGALNPSDRHIMYINTSDFLRTVVFDDSDATMAGLTSSATVPDDAATVLTYVMNDASSESKINDANTTTGGTAGTTTQHTAITIGNSLNNDRAYGIQIARVLICDGAHSTAAQDAITDYFGTTYGISGLPD